MWSWAVCVLALMVVHASAQYGYDFGTSGDIYSTPYSNFEDPAVAQPPVSADPASDYYVTYADDASFVPSPNAPSIITGDDYYVTYADDNDGRPDEEDAIGDDLDDLLSPDYKELVSDTLVLLPNGCDTVEFSVNRSSIYKLSLEPILFAKGCSLQDDIEVTKGAYYQGECLEFDKNLMCARPSKLGIRNADDMCENLSDLVTGPYTPSVSSRIGALCVPSVQHFVSIKSSCARPAAIRAQVIAREATRAEAEVCPEVVRITRAPPPQG